MARLAPPDPPLRDDVVALRRWERSDAAALVERAADVGYMLAAPAGG